MSLKVLVVLILVAKWGATQIVKPQANGVEQQLNIVQNQLDVLRQKVELTAKEASLTSQINGRISNRLTTLERYFDVFRSNSSLGAASSTDVLTRKIDESNKKLEALEDKLDLLADLFTNKLESLKPAKQQHPSSCVEIFEEPKYNKVERGYIIQITASSPQMRVYCMADPNGGLPWTIVQRRINNTNSSKRSFRDFKMGFGKPSRDFFIGLTNLNLLTTEGGPQEVWVQLTAPNGKTMNAYYDEFVIGNETEGFPLKSLGAYSGDGFDILTPFVGKQFNTIGNENFDVKTLDCEDFLSGSWCQWNGSNGMDRSKRKPSLKYSHVGIRPSRKNLLSNK